MVILLKEGEEVVFRSVPTRHLPWLEQWLLRASIMSLR